MILDSSAVLAILRAEPEAPDFARRLEMASVCRLSAANFVEAAIVIDSRRNPIASRKFDDLLAKAGVQIESVTPEQARVARAAYRDFGKGSGHPAQLNYGDCFAYALSKLTGEPLLYKGDDFRHTDVAPAS